VNLSLRRTRIQRVQSGNRWRKAPWVLVALLSLGAGGCLWWTNADDDDEVAAPVATNPPATAATTPPPPPAPTTAAPATTTAPTTTEAPTTTAAPAVLLADVIADRPDLSTLASLLDTTGLDESLRSEGPITVLAPNDAAFTAVPSAELDALAADPDLLSDVLLGHVFDGRNLAADVAGASSLTALSGTEWPVEAQSETVLVGNAAVLEADIEADNGVLHIIDAVLVPVLSGPAFDTGAAVEDFVVFFDSGSSDLDLIDVQTIADAVEVLRVLPSGTEVAIIGHADTTGDAAANRALSLRRADTVLAEIQRQLGANPLIFTTDARGSTEPTTDLASSRRVSIEIP
jgi:uncharacterized surface protein with fasciclin (FAS1) repeats